METTSQHQFDRDETIKGNSHGINEIRFLYLALNDVAAFEQAVNARGKTGIERAVNSTSWNPDASSCC